MKTCDTSNGRVAFPYSEFCPSPGAAGVQIDIRGNSPALSMEVNLIGDAAASLRADPL